MNINILHKKTRIFYTVHLLLSLFLLIGIFFLYKLTPTETLQNKQVITSTYQSIYDTYQEGQQYIQIALPEKLLNTGYEYQLGKQENFTFYYSLEDQKCIFYLISPKTQKALQSSPSQMISGKLIMDEKIYNNLLDYMAQDLSWKRDDLEEMASPIIVSETIETSSKVELPVIILLTIGGILTLSCLSALFFLAFPGISFYYRKLIRHYNI
jgi:hypothetical protein